MHQHRFHTLRSSWLLLLALGVLVCPPSVGPISPVYLAFFPDTPGAAWAAPAPSPNAGSAQSQPADGPATDRTLDVDESVVPPESMDGDPAGAGADGGVGAGVETDPGEIRVQVRNFGVGNVARPGEWTGVWLRLMDSAPASREVLLRVVGLDNDGDRPVYTRLITLNPGRWQDAWVYLRLPFSYSTSSPMTVVLAEPVRTGAGAGAGAGSGGGSGTTLAEYEPGRILARRPLIASGRIIGANEGMLLMLGTTDAAISKYASARSTSNVPNFRHEASHNVAIADASAMPDRWEGLAGFGEIVWGQGLNPSGLSVEQVRAIREWIRRGGHLVVCLPPDSSAWTDSSLNGLHDLLPAVTVNRIEGASLEPYRGLLTMQRLARDERPLAALPTSAVLHTFVPQASAGPGEADVILTGPQGECVVAQRSVGIGAVTLIGLPLYNTRFTRGDVIEVEAFWHRILGRRGTVDPRGPLANVNAPLPVPVYLDSFIDRSISKLGTAAAGLLMGFVVFLLYWLLAGPIGFALLKRFGLARLAWPAFAGTAVVFTVIAFGLASLLKPRQTDALHFTVLDHVFGQPTQRTRTFFSLYDPRTGVSDIRVGDAEGLLTQDDGMRRELGGILAPWDPPGEPSDGRFLDSREYTVDARTPDELPVPIRSTVKQVHADWAGSPRLKMPAPGPEGIRLENGRLTGTISHDLPGALRDVRILYVRRQIDLGAPAVGRGALISQGVALSAPVWEPGQTIDLSALSEPGKFAALETTVDNWLPAVASIAQITGVGAEVSTENAINAMSFFSMLKTPQPSTSPAGMLGNYAAAQRRLFHGMDLSRWFTRPCLIVVGVLRDGPTPTPIYVNGEALESSGTTVVRWVYPLPTSPPQYMGRPEGNAGGVPEDLNDPNADPNAEPQTP